MFRYFYVWPPPTHFLAFILVCVEVLAFVLSLIHWELKTKVKVSFIYYFSVAKGNKIRRCTMMRNQVYEESAIFRNNFIYNNINIFY